MIGQGIITETSTTGNLLALEGTPVHSHQAAGSTFPLGAFTTTKAALIVITNMNNAASEATSITGGGLTWTKRTNQANPEISVWTAPAAAALSAVTFTINYGGDVGFNSADLFAISGYNTVTPYDANASIPAVSATDPITVSTNNNFDFILGAFRFATTASPTQGAGWTLISGADFFMTEYKIVQVAQTNLSVSVGTGVGDANGGVADAVMSA